MTKKSILPKRRYHVHLYIEDWTYLCAYYGAGSETNIGVSAALAEMVHSFVKRLKAKGDDIISSGRHQ